MGNIMSAVIKPRAFQWQDTLLDYYTILLCQQCSPLCDSVKKKQTQQGRPVLLSSLWAFSQFPQHGYKQHFILQMCESFLSCPASLTNSRHWYWDKREAKAQRGSSYWLQTWVISFILEIKIVCALLATSSGVTSLSQSKSRLWKYRAEKHLRSWAWIETEITHVFNHSCSMSVLWNGTQNNFWDQQIHWKSCYRATQ